MALMLMGFTPQVDICSNLEVAVFHRNLTSKPS
jgi:hypothetical protein